MTIERGGRPHSPVHLHVDETTPVHVHVKKDKKSGASWAVEGRLSETKAKSSHGSSNLRRSTATATARSRSKSPTGPWVPPPGKTSKSNKYSWQGASHRLDIGLPADVSGVETTLHRSDLSTDDDKMTTCRKSYERKIDDLMNEVGTLKNEVALQRTIRKLEKRDDELESSRRVMEQQEFEIEETRRELEATELENRALRHSSDDTFFKTPDRHKEREMLMKKLVEVEMDGQAAAKQAAAIKDATRRLREDKSISSSDVTILTKQKDLLMERIGDFEGSNRMLRKMLRDRHEDEADCARLAEQRDLLLKKLSETEDNLQPLLSSTSLHHHNMDCDVRELVGNLFTAILDQRAMLIQYIDLLNAEAMRLRSGTLDKERAITDFRMQVDAQRDENLALASLQSSLETTRAHLQKQLRQKEADCNRMAVQVRTLESQLAQEKIEVDRLTGLLTQAKEKADHDKEALKKATRVQKQRATRSEDALEQLSAQLLERDTHIAELRSELENLRSHCDKFSKEKSQNHAENVALKTVSAPTIPDNTMRMTELENIMLTMEDASKSQVETATNRLHSKTSEAATFKLENERLKTSLITIEDKLVQADNEVSQLRGNLRQYETLIDEYRSQTQKIPYPVIETNDLEYFLKSDAARLGIQMNRSRREADDTMAMLDEQKKETKRISKDSDVELDKVKSRLQSRLTELAPLPELLKTTELRLQDSSEKLLQYEKRNTENTKLIAELTAKVEHQADQLNQLHDRVHTSQEESRGQLSKSDNLERRLRELEDHNRELLKTVAKREEALHQSNVRLDEKNHENASLNRQMESLLTDARRLNDSARDKAAAKDRTSQSRLLEVEAQLSQARAEIARIKREKDESERKFNSRLYDIKDRLEQSHSTNRSMQNYVQFLKNSYANVFGDASVVTSSPMRSTFY